MPAALPGGVHVLTFATRLSRSDAGAPQWVLRLHNVMNAHEGAAPLVVGDIAKLFNKEAWAVTACTEATLTLQQPRAASSRYTWWPATDSAAEREPSEQEPQAPPLSCAGVALAPKDIRTFVLEFAAAAACAAPR